MNLRDNLATNVRKYRAQRGLTQEELADQTGISARYLGSVERAKVSASITVLENLATALGVDPCALLTAHKSR